MRLLLPPTPLAGKTPLLFLILVRQERKKYPETIVSLLWNKKSEHFLPPRITEPTPEPASNSLPPPPP